MNRQRNTKQRQLVLDVIRSHCEHPSADEIYLAARAIDDKISRGTVYRNLNILVRQGEVLRVKLPHVDRYELRLDKHYHLLCHECGAVCDVALPYHLGLDEQVAKSSGYAIDRHRTIFEGLCPDCQKKKE